MTATQRASMVILKAKVINSISIMISHRSQKSASVPLEARGPLMNHLLDWKSTADGAGQPRMFLRPLCRFIPRTQLAYDDAHETGRYAGE
jgi:hypothetical protein